MNDNQQLIEYLRDDKGITFNITDESTAITILSESTYYYKVTCFRKNFDKDIFGKYRNLDFATLNDMAIVDMRLRYLIMQMALDLEHSLKTDLINSISDDPNENGRQIVIDYDNFERRNFFSNPYNRGRSYRSIELEVIGSRNDPQDYDFALVNTYTVVGRRNNPPVNNPLPIWVLLEKMSFGKVERFINYYCNNSRYNSNHFKNANELLKMTKRLRDAAAHSRPILMNIVETAGPGTIPRVSTPVTDSLRSLGLFTRNNRRLLKNVRVHDFFCLIILHNEYVKNPIVKSIRKKELEKVLHRATVNKKLYTYHRRLKEIHAFLQDVMKKV